MSEAMQPGLLIVYSGPSGVGKGTILAPYLAAHPETVLSVSVTTRAPRPGERDGIDYSFITRERFDELAAGGGLLEYAEYSGNCYGTPRAAVETQLAAGRNVLLEIEVQGAEQVMDHRSDLVSIFITIPSMEELERRLRDRGTENEQTIRGRMEVARRELTRAFRYDYVVLNDEVEQAVGRINTIIDAEKMRYSRMEKMVLEVLQDAQTNGY